MCHIMIYSLHFLMVHTLFLFFFQAETCSLSIPDLEFEMGGYALGGRFTTLEGLLNNVHEQVDTNPLWGATTAVGDSAQKDRKDKVEKFKSDLKALTDCKKLPFSIILDDPAGNSYIQVLLITFSDYDLLRPC